ncbi:hypothetical protein [Mucisphaera sp.]|uniref:hypothetical protein n=1 Tax=Mucisphaera sp. TaxID=2913024 RepID=UPI003D0A2C0B
MPTTQRKQRRILLSTVLGLLVFLPLSAYFVNSFLIARALEEAKQRAIASGDPITAADLNNRQLLPDDQNSALGFAEVYTLLENQRETQPEFEKANDEFQILLHEHDAARQLGQTYPADVYQEIQTHLTRNQQIIQAALDVSITESGRMPVDYTSEFPVNAVLMPWLGQARDLARLLGLQAIANAQTNQREKAVDTLIAQQNLARSLRNDPSLLSQLIGISIDAEAKQAIEEVLATLPLDSQALSRIRENVIGGDPVRRMTRAITAERVFSLQAIDMHPNTWDALLNEPFTRTAYFLLGGHNKSRLDIHEKYETLKAMDPMNFHQVIESSSKHLSIGPSAVAEMLDSSYVGAMKIAVAIHHSYTITDTALAIHLYINDNGSLPKSLESLVPDYLPEIPPDHLNPGSNLLMETTDSGLRLHSAGNPEIYTSEDQSPIEFHIIYPR